MAKPIKNLFYYYRIYRRKGGENCAKIGRKSGKKKGHSSRMPPSGKILKRLCCVCALQKYT